MCCWTLAAAASSNRHLLKRTQLLNGECMCSHTLSSLLTEADQCIFGPRTMMFLTMARFKLWGNGLCLAHTTKQSRPCARQLHKESVFPSLVWRIWTGLHRASLPDFTNALVTEREQIPAGSSTSGGNPFPQRLEAVIRADYCSWCQNDTLSKHIWGKYISVRILLAISESHE